MSQYGAPAIVQQFNKNSVSVEIPLAGFPAGFQLRPGERVMVLLQGNSLVARPLVQMAFANESADDLASAGKVDINNQPHTLQPATVSAQSGKRGTTVFVVDPGSAAGPRQIIATRPQ